MRFPRSLVADMSAVEVDSNAFLDQMDGVWVPQRPGHLMRT